VATTGLQETISVARYRYYVADILTGQVVMEVPFSSVSWERKVSAAGSFSGSIPADLSQDHFDLYNSTLPGKFALYVMRNETCVWGGIIWSREYSITDRRLTVGALEFVSYLHHRVLWKSTSFAAGISVKTFLQQLLIQMLTDQGSVNAGIGYSASDIHRKITAFQKDAAGVVTITTLENHGYSVDHVLYISGMYESGIGSAYDGVQIVTSVPTSTSFTYSSGVTGAVASTYVTGGAALNSSRITVNAAAAINLKINIDNDLDGYSINPSGDIGTFTYEGSKMDYIGELIGSYASNGVPCSPVPGDLYTVNNNTIVRFDYWVECKYNIETLTFENTFRAWYVHKDLNNPTQGTEIAPELDTLYGPTKLGANHFVFEHPGNIIEISMSEEADSTSTRTWVVDSQNDLGTGGQLYYASYTNLNYMNAGWPLIETAHTDRDYRVSSTEADQGVLPYAHSVGQRSTPPHGSYTVTVNGSISPTVDEYAPGDWCVVIPNDAFLNYRLRPPYENRENVLVRKIVSMKVSVPDNPAFPETVDLELIPEWEATNV
jgi:hypothetical protein